MKYIEIYDGPIIDLTHLAEDISGSTDELSDNNNETKDDFDFLTAN